MAVWWSGRCGGVVCEGAWDGHAQPSVPALGACPPAACCARWAQVVVRDGHPLDALPPPYEELDYVPKAISSGACVRARVCLCLCSSCFAACSNLSGLGMAVFPPAPSPHLMRLPPCRPAAPAGDVPVLSVEYASDGQVTAKTSIGGPVGSSKCGRALAPVNAGGRLPGAASSGGLLGGARLGEGGVGGGRQVALVLLLSCVMAAVAAVASAYQSSLALSRVLDLPWLS